jgi:hypothetical protein
MNERIEAYLKQHYCRDYFNRYGETVEDDYYFMYRDEVDGLIELIVQESIQYLNNEIERLSIYGRTIPEENAYMRDSVDICIEKCYDNIQGLKEHFGVDE